MFNAAIEDIKKLEKVITLLFRENAVGAAGSAKGCKSVIQRLLKLLTNLKIP